MPPELRSFHPILCITGDSRRRSRTMRSGRDQVSSFVLPEGTYYHCSFFAEVSPEVCNFDAIHCLTGYSQRGCGTLGGTS
jgi:hypothetical protein